MEQSDNLKINYDSINSSLKDILQNISKLCSILESPYIKENNIFHSLYDELDYLLQDANNIILILNQDCNEDITKYKTLIAEIETKLINVIHKIKQISSSLNTQISQMDELASTAVQTSQYIEYANIRLNNLLKDFNEKTNFDELTGLYNHRYIQEYIRDMLNHNPHQQISLIFCDIDNFKYINERYGYIVGDKLLSVIGEIIKEFTDENSTASRFGGEEFLIITKLDQENTYKLSEQILKSIEEKPVEAEDTIINVTASIGISTYPKDGTDKDILIANADKAVRYAKILGKSNIQIYNKEQHDKISRRQMARDQLILNSAYALSAAVDAKSHHTHKHSVSVAFLSQQIARAMNLPSQFVRKLFIAGLLHDIGKIGVPDAILNKPDRLDNDEWKIMKSHSTMGWEILRHVKLFEDISLAIRHHHERFDGKGYPDNLAGDGIPLMSRILTVADSFNAMTSDRSYREALSKEQALEEVIRNIGTQFDPDIAKLFTNYINDIDFEDDIDFESLENIISNIK